MTNARWLPQFQLVFLTSYKESMCSWKARRRLMPKPCCSPPAYGLPAQGEGALSPYAVIDRERLARAKSIALIGSGLTMVDMFLAARRDGFVGTTTILSRHGQWPRPHAPKAWCRAWWRFPPRSGCRCSPPPSASLARRRTHGTPWQAIINGLRPQVQEIWRSLPISEQARFLHHVRPFWNAHRHRLPMQVHASVQAEFESGR